jgi:hypothetical protein
MIGVRLCAWHESRQQLLSLPGLVPSHGICPICFEVLLRNVKPNCPEWVHLIEDGNWHKFFGAGFWPMFFREIEGGRVQCVCHLSGADMQGGIGWQLSESGVEVFRGDLDACLLRAEDC